MSEEIKNLVRQQFGASAAAYVTSAVHAQGASLARLIQTGFIYWYALVMLLGVFGLLTWQLWPTLSGLLGR